MVLDPHPWPLDVAWRNLCREHDDILHALQPDQLCIGAGLLNNVWRPPMDDFTKVNTDVSFCGTKNCSGGGGLLRNRAGGWITGFASRMHGGGPFVAEATDLRNGLAMAWNQGVRQLSCDVDCEELVNILHSTHRDQVRFHPQVLLLNEIMELMARDWRASVHRDGNAAADWLAKHGLSLLAPGIFNIVQPESELQLILMKDSLVVP